MLDGIYARRAAKTHKTKEGRELLATVRAFIVRIDLEMKKPSSFERDFGSR